jgi:hypothetical protein
LFNNNFTGSLEHLSEMKRLKYLDIGDTDVSHGLEYLPKSIHDFKCSLESKPQARVSDIRDELQSFERTEVEINGRKYNDGGLKKWRETKLDKKLSLVTSPLLPPQLLVKQKQKTSINDKEEKIKNLKSQPKSGDKIADLTNELLLEKINKELAIQK